MAGTLWMVVAALPPFPTSADDYYVDPIAGSDAGVGTVASPYRTVSAVLAKLPEVVTTRVNIHLAPGTYANTGGHATPSGTLVLDRKMRRASDFEDDVSVRFLGEGPGFQGKAAPGQVILDWNSTPLVRVSAGVWHFEYLQIGNRSYANSQQGIEAYGTDSLVRLENVRIRTASESGAGILASRGAEVRLIGAVELNDDLHETVLPLSFCGIIADYHGAIRMIGSDGSLSLGNGSLSASYYGTIELGGRWARITSWGQQSNCLAVNNSGRIDLHGTTTTLCARRASNALIGLEDDGNILAEGATIHLQTIAEVTGKVILQKSSRLYGGPIMVEGPQGAEFATMSGSTLVASAVGVIDKVSADTGSYCYLRCASNPTSVLQLRNGKVDIEVAGELSCGRRQINRVAVDQLGGLGMGWDHFGLWYTVEFKTNVADVTWLPAPGIWPTMENQWSKPTTDNGGANFYRVRSP